MMDIQTVSDFTQKNYTDFEADLKQCCKENAAMFCFKGEQIICVNGWSTDGHKLHSEFVESLAVSAKKQLEDWIFLDQEIKSRLNEYHNTHKMATCAGSAAFKVEKQLKEVFSKIHKHVDVQYAEKLKALEDAIVAEHSSNEQTEKFREIVQRVDNLYRRVEESKAAADKKGYFQNYAEVMQMRSLMKQFLEEYKSLEVFNEEPIDSKFSNTKMSVDEQILKEGIDNAVKIDSDLFQGKTDKRVFYIDDTSLCTYSLLTDSLYKKVIDGVESLPQKYSTIEVNNKIYIGGGEEIDDLTGAYENVSKVYLIDETENELIDLKSMVFSRKGHSLTFVSKTDNDGYLDEHIIIASGSYGNDDVSKSTEFMTLSSNDWLRGPNMNIGRYNHSSLVFNNEYLYVFGGRDPVTEQAIDSIEMLDINSDEQVFNIINVKQCETWTSGDTMGTAAIDESSILIFGGNGGFTAQSFIFDTEDNSIKEISQMSKPESFFNSQAYKHGNDKIYITGMIDKDLHIFCTTNQKWHMLEKQYLGW